MGDGTAGSRRVLADVSNQLGKRRFVSISSNLDPNSATGDRKNTENESSKSDLGWCVSRKGSENSIKGKCEVKFSSRGDFPIVEPKKPCVAMPNLGVGVGPNLQQAAMDVSKVPHGTMKIMGLFDGKLPFMRRDALKQSGLNRGDESVSCVPVHKAEKSVVGGTYSETNANANGDVNIVVTDVSGDNGGGTDGGADRVSVKSSSIGCSGVSGSSGSQVFGAEKCGAFSADFGMDTSGGVDFLNSCSCSFCHKAAYIWADLHYQDTKGRIAAIKKSKKEVRSVVDRRYNHGQLTQNAQGESGKSTKLVADLNGQWRTLFLHTEDIFTRESNQLQSKLLNLKELRDNCKDDLEVINATFSNNKHDL